MYQFVTNNHVSFHLRWKENLLNHQTVSNYYEYDCRSTLIDLNPDEPRYYPLLLSLDRYKRNYNTLDDLSDRLCVPNKTKDENVKVV